MIGLMRLFLLALIWGVVLLRTHADSSAPDRPNILWLTSEDNNVNWVGCYGNPHAQTPHIDKLASEGFQYLNCFANAPVCAPSRSGWITGMHPVSLGTIPMRSRYNIPHDLIKYYPDYLRGAGYFCSNVRKTDYNIGGRADDDCWQSLKVNWRELGKKQPFFQVINLATSHESRAFGSVENTKHSPNDIRLAKYHPDLLTIRKNYAHYHDAVARMDGQVGDQLRALEKQGLSENTIVVYNSDHGGVLPRSKRFLFNSGTHCPLIIRIPKKYRSMWPTKSTGSKIDRLVSFIDMPKTWLSLAGIKAPEFMQGRVFLGASTEPERTYHISYRERMDERMDNQRAIRNKRFLYIRNYMAYVPWGQRLNYLWKMEATRAWENWHKAGKTDDLTGRWFGEKPSEELYDTLEDPDNVTNLINDPKHSNMANELRKALDQWQLKVRDLGLLPESERVKRAEEFGVTLHELANNPQAYQLESYLHASNIALQRDPKKIQQLLGFLQDGDSGVRYWGIAGFCLLGKKAASVSNEIEHALRDDSHAVRATAAFTLYRLGKKEKARETLRALLRQDSHSSLLVLNMIDWLGVEKEVFRKDIEACKFSDQGYIERMKVTLFQ